MVGYWDLHFKKDLKELTKELTKQIENKEYYERELHRVRVSKPINELALKKSKQKITKLLNELKEGDF